MNILRKEDIVTPISTKHGETIYELLGREVGESSERHSIAQVTILPGDASLLHYHPKAEESYFILKGKAKILIGEEETVIEHGHTVLIKALTPHKIVNIGEGILEFLAICVPAWEPNNTVWLEE